MNLKYSLLEEGFIQVLTRSKIEDPNLVGALLNVVREAEETEEMLHEIWESVRRPSK